MAALAYSAAKQEWDARRYASLAVEAGLVEDGPRDEWVRELRKL